MSNSAAAIRPQIERSVKIEEISLMRTMGIILVVLAHATHAYTGGWVYNLNGGRLFGLLTNYIYTFHMPLFVFISGFLFYLSINLKKTEELEGFVTKKAKRLLLPYFMIGLFYLLPIKYLLGLYQWQDLPFVLKNNLLLSYNPGHLWFLLMLFNLYLGFYLLHLEKRKSFSIKIFTILFALSLLSSFFPQELQIKASLFYAFFFYSGYVLSGLVLEKKIRFSKSKILLISFVVQLVSAFLLLKTFSGSNFVIAGSLKLVAGLSGSVMVYYLSVLFMPLLGALRKIIFEIDKYSMGIYLLHEEIIFVVLNYLSRGATRPLYAVAISFLLSFALAFLLAKFIGKTRYAFALGMNL